MKGMNGFLGGMGQILWDRGGISGGIFGGAEEVVLEEFLDRTGKAVVLGRTYTFTCGFYM
jgi:hypothetical protein